MPNVLPIPKLWKAELLLAFLFTVKLSCLLQVEVQLFKDEW